MYVVQFGYFSWLDPDGHLTTSGAHAGRYPTLLQAQDAAQSLVVGSAAMEHATEHLPPRLRSFYGKDSVVAATVVPLTELEARLAKRDAPAAGSAPVAAQPSDTKPRQGGGVTRAIFQWVLDHPEATKADTLAAWPLANASTVGVQYGAARKASQAT